MNGVPAVIQSHVSLCFVTKIDLTSKPTKINTPIDLIKSHENSPRHALALGDEVCGVAGSRAVLSWPVELTFGHIKCHANLTFHEAKREKYEVV